MELPKISVSEGGMLNDIKSKLGIGSKKSSTRDAYDDYDTYDDDRYDSYDSNETDYEYYESYDGYDDSYDSQRGRSRWDSYDARETSRYDRGASAGGVTRPRLVSIDDVRANTQLEIDAHADREARPTAGASIESSSFDFTAPSHELRSEGLNSLFSPTTNDYHQASASLPSVDKQGEVSPLSEQPTMRPAGVSYQAFSASPYSASGQAAASQRPLTVVKPMSYGDVEHMAQVVRTGGIMVLSLRNTQEALAHRLLDFSFGVASAFDARIDCIGNNVFAVCTGNALSSYELQELRNQGVL